MYDLLRFSCYHCTKNEEVLNSFMTESLSYRNQSTDLQSKSMDWLLYDNGLRHERVSGKLHFLCVVCCCLFVTKFGRPDAKLKLKRLEKISKLVT